MTKDQFDKLHCLAAAFANCQSVGNEHSDKDGYLSLREIQSFGSDMVDTLAILEAEIESSAA